MKDILNELRADYTQNYVVYPLPLVDELQELIEDYRLLLISVGASSFIRFKRAKEKYEFNNLEKFMEIDHQF